MTQIFFPPSSDRKQQKICCYVNNLAKIVIAKISRIKNRDCERVIFPAERFLFAADDDCQLEIDRQTNLGIIRESIACFELKVVES